MKMYNFKQNPLMWVLLIYFAFAYRLYAQPHKILVVNDLGVALPNMKIIINKSIEMYTDSTGELNFSGYLKNIEINQDDYYFIENNVNKDGFYKIVLIKTYLLNEIIVSRKDSIINNYEPKNDRRDFYCGYNNQNLALLTAFETTKNWKLLNYSFYISSGEKYNKAFNFVIYSDNEKKLEKIYSENIEKYKQGNNTFDFTSKNINLKSGNYLFGMEWIICEPKKNILKKFITV